jgi:Mu DNA-binding domain
MKNKWFTPKEITTMPGMPTTIQGVHKRAKREGWLSRRKLGVQGPAIEFCMVVSEESHHVSENSGVYQSPLLTSEQDLRAVWLAVFNQLTEKNRTLLINNILQYGVYQLINYDNNSRAGKIITLLDSLPLADQESILKMIKAKQWAVILESPSLSAAETDSGKVE